MMYIYVSISLLLLIYVSMIMLKVRTKNAIKSELGIMHGDTIILNDQSYKLVMLHVPHKASLYVNSPKVIEIRHRQSDVQFYDLKKGYVFVIYPSVEKMFVTLNENEVRFFDDLECIHGSFFVRRQQIKAFLRSKQSD